MKLSKRNLRQRLKDRISIIAFLAIFIIIAYKPIKAYFSPITFDHFYVFAKPTSSNSFSTRFLRLTYTTPSAFLPYEKVRVKAYLGAPADGGKPFRPYIFFNEAEFTNNKINKNQEADYEESQASQNEYEKRFMTYTANLLFKTTATPNLYEGECELFYKNEGEFENSLMWRDGEGAPLKHKVKIASSTDLMNKRTNDLLFIIALLGLLIPFYFEFRKK